MPTPQVIITPDASTPQLAEAVIELQRILTKGLGIGDPGQGEELPRKATGATPVRPRTRLGRPDNLFGNLVDVTIDQAADLSPTNVEVTHGLNLPVPADRTVAAQAQEQILNCRWIVCGVRYLSNNAVVVPAGADHRVLVLYVDGIVGANSIGLRFCTDLTIPGANAAGIQVSLMFFPASQ